MARKHLWRVLILAVVAVIAVAGCGDDDDSDTGDDSAATSGLDLEGAQAQIDAFREIPEFTAPGDPVDASAAAGKKLAIVPASSNVPFVATIFEGMERIGTDAGLDVTVFNNNGTPAEWSQGVTDALSNNADSIDLLAGLDPAAISAQVTRATGDGKSVVATHLYDVNQEVDPNITAATNIPYEQAGRLLADWAIVRTEGQANVLLTVITQVNSTAPMVEGIRDEFATRCGDTCQITEIDTTIADLGMLQQQVQSTLTANPDINYVINLYDSAQAPQTVAAINALGRDDLKIATFNGTPDILAMIGPDSVIEMDVGENLEWIAYGAIDQHLRLLSGAEPTTTPNLPIRIFDETNVSEATAGENAGFGDAYGDAYRELWGLS